MQNRASKLEIELCNFFLDKQGQAVHRNAVIEDIRKQTNKKNMQSGKTFFLNQVKAVNVKDVAKTETIILL